MSQPPLFASGSNFNMFGVVQPDATTLLVGSTTATGGDTQTGDGILRIVDVSNPLALAEHSTFTVPGTTQVQGIVLEGDLALVLASEGGWLDPFVTASDIGPTGNIVLATLDVSDPRNPLLLDTHTVVRAARGMGGPVALGFGQFLFWSLGGLADTPQLFRVNAGDPLAIAVSTPVNLTDPPRRGDVDASYLYLADGHGLTIFSFHSAPTPITAEVRIPNDGSVEVVPGSFSIAPDSVVPSVGFDTLTWTLQNGATLTWNALLDDMLPGERREVALGATVDFVYSATPGSIELPEIAVAAEQILAIDPPARTVAPGVTTSYDLTVRNPTASAKNYALAVQALPAAWVDLPSAVMVPAHSESVLPLEVTPDGFAVPGDYEFSVLATSGAIAGSVSATLEVAGAAVFPPPMPTAAGVVVELTPSQATGGQGTAAFFVARVTNTGSATASFDLGGMFPAGFVATFEEDQVGLQPGLDQFRDVTLALTPPIGTAGGLYPFQVTAAGALDPSVNDQAGGSILVSTLGVALELEPDPPGSITDFDLTVTNTGMATASFDLDLAGPLAADAMLGAPTVMLGASQSTVVAVTLGTPDGILAGLHPLIAVATAQANPAVQATATTLVDIPETTALEAEIAPAEVMTDPGNVERLVFTIRNAGNVEIELRAFLSDLEGPIDADLLGLDGMPAAMVEGFRLPPFGETGLDIDATLLTAGEGEVTARVERVDDTDVAAIATALLGDNLCGAGSAGGYDIDLTGTVQPLTDALLILRHLFGFGGSPLVIGAIGTGAARSDAAAITAYLQCIRLALLDVDGDGAAGPLTDGLLLLRYMFGFRGAVLVANAVGVDCERCNGEAIEGFIEGHLVP
jgi:hypothetical protein